MVYFKVMSGRFPFRSFLFSKNELYDKIKRVDFAMPVSFEKVDRKVVSSILRRKPLDRMPLAATVELLEKELRTSHYRIRKN